MRKLSLLVLSLAAVAMPRLSFAAPLAMVTNQAANAVHVYRSDTWTLTTVIPIGNGAAPSGIAIPPTGGFALVANRGNGTVSRINLPPSSVSATFAVPGGPTSVAITPDGTRAYVVQSTNCPAPVPTPGPSPTPGPTPTPGLGPPCTVAAIDAASGAILATITVGHQPFAVAMSPSGAFAYVTNRADGTLSVIDVGTNTVVTTVPAGNTPEGVTVGSGEIFVTNDTDNTATVLREVDYSPVTGSPIAVGASPLGVAVSPDGQTAVVSNDADGTVSLLSASTLATLATPTVGTNPAGIGILPDSSAAVIANNTNNSLSVVSLPGGGVLNIPIVGAPVGVAITPEPNYSLKKLASQDPIIAGSTVTYSLTYTNIGSGNAASVTIDDPVPANLTFLSATGGGVLSGTDVVWTIAAIPAGGSGSVQATYTVASPLPDLTKVDNTATISDVDGHTASAFKRVLVKSRPRYSLALTGAPNPVAAGAQLVYTLTYGNVGTDVSPATALVLTYDPYITFVSAYPPPDAASITHWTIGDLPVGGSGTITITVNVNSPLANGTLLQTQALMTDSTGDSGAVTAANTVESAPGLTLSSTDSPDPVAADGIVLYDFTYGNTGNANATGAVLTIGYDPNVTYVDSNIPPDAGTTNQFTLGTVVGGTSGRVRIHVQVTHVIPNGTVVHTTGQIIDGLGNTASTAVDTTVQSAPTLSLAKTDSPDPVAPDGTLTYTLTYGNPGSDTATGVVVTETYPAEVTFVSAIPAPDAGTTNQWTIGTLTPGATGSITIVTTATGLNGSIANNTAVISDGAGHSATGTSSTIVALVPVLTVGITDGPDPIAPGGLLTYTITYGNTLGTGTASGLVLTADLPAGTTFVSGSPAPDPGTNNQWTIGSLPAGGSGTITVRAAVDPAVVNGTVLVAQATLQDDALHSASASATTSVLASANLALAVSVSPDPVPAGGSITYTLSYGNQGTVPVDGVVLTQTYDPGLTFVSAIPPPDFAETAVWTLGTLAPGAAGSIQITLSVNPALANGSVLVSQAALTSSGGDFAQGTEISKVGSVPLTLGLTSSPNPVLVGGALTYTLSYTNNTAQPISGLTIDFDPDPRTVFLQATPAPPVAGTLSWTVGIPAHGSGSISIQALVGSGPGAIVTARASATNGTVNAAAVDNVAAQAGGSLDKVTLGRYFKLTPGLKPADRFQVKAIFPYTGSLDPNGALGLIIATRDRVLAPVYIPAGHLTQLGKTILRYSGPSSFAGGGTLQVIFAKDGSSKARLSVVGSKFTLPMSDSLELHLTLAAPIPGGGGFSAVHDFRKLSKSTVSSQFLAYP